MFKRLWRYINPMAHLGEKTYPFRFPFFTTIVVYVALEIISNFIWKHPNDIGNIIIFVNFALVLYFSFRSALKGGFTVLALSILYYFYFIYTRDASVAIKEYASLISGLLSLTNLIIVLLVGWHRKSLDTLLDREVQAKIAAEQEQNKWQTLLDQLPIGVVIAKAPSGEVIRRNKRAIQLVGEEKKLIKSIDDYQNADAYSNNKKITPKDWPLAQAILKGKTTIEKEIMLINNRGKKMVLLFNAAPVIDNKGKVIAAVTTFNDISKQKELERQKNDFIAMASHELKTPLTSAKIYAQALLKGSTQSPKLANLSMKINEQVDRLSNLVTTMLDASRMEEGKLTLNEEPFVFRDLALKILFELEEVMTRKLTIDWQTREYLYGNRERITQVFTNLVTNAIKFSSIDSQIIIRSRKQNESVIVSVQDFGIGISQKDQKYVFDKFYHANEHKTYPGLGLGLYISSEIIKQHGGKMWVTSEEGKGSTFYFSLPIYKKSSIT